MSIECMMFRSINRGSLIGFAKIWVPKMGIEIENISFFQSNGRRWISLPSKEYEKDGEKKYYPLVRFREKGHMDMFTKAVIDAIEQWCKANEKAPAAAPVQEQKHEQSQLPF